MLVFKHSLGSNDVHDHVRLGIYTSSRTSFAAETPRQMPSGGVHLMGRTQLELERNDASRSRMQEARAKQAAAESRLVEARKAARRQSTMDAAAASSRKSLEDRPPARDAAPCTGGRPVPVLRELVLGRKTVRTAWAPGRLTVTEEAGTDERTLFGVRYADMFPMLSLLAPQLASAFGANIAPRGGRGQRDHVAEARRAPRRARVDSAAPAKHKKASQSRGGSIITTGSTKKSSSGPHKDDTDSLLLCVSGDRMVWYAKPRVGKDTSKRDGDYKLGAPVYLPSQFDPSAHSVSDIAKMTGAPRWCPPVTLTAGDAIWIKNGWWHCIVSEPDSVAVAIEVESMMVGGDTPCVWRGVAPCRISEPNGRRVSKAKGWHSGVSVRALWNHALLEFRE